MNLSIFIIVHFHITVSASERINNKLAGQILSWKKLIEKEFDETSFKRVDDYVFCVKSHMKRRQLTFKIHESLQYYYWRSGQSKKVYFGFDKKFIAEAFVCEDYLPKSIWTFERLVENDINYEMISFTHGHQHRKLRFINHEAQYHGFSSSSDEEKVMICDVRLDQSVVVSVNSFPVPSFEEHDCKFFDIGKRTSDNFWYEAAAYLSKVKPKKLRRSKGKDPPRDIVDNLSIYGDEEDFIAAKISPNVPQSIKINCSGILKLDEHIRLPQVGFVGYFGSGNHLVRLLMEMISGQKTCSSLEENG